MNIIRTTLEKICLPEKASIISGPFGSNIGKRFFVDNGIPVIRGNNLSTTYDKFYDKGFVYVTKEKADELNCYAYRDDIIFTAAGTLGQVGIIPRDSKYKEYVISNKQIRARINSDIVNVYYAYYWLSSPWIQKMLIDNNKGSTVPLLTLNEVRELPIYYPENVEDQIKIVSILEAISKKIETNKKINDNLQQQLQTMYGYLFNCQYVPVSWRKGILSDIASITMGQSPDGASYNENGEGYLFYQGSTDFGEIFPMARVYTTQPTRMAYAMDTLLSVRAPVGTMNIAYEQCCIGRGLAAIHGSQDNNIFVRYLLRNNQWYFDNINNSGTTFGSLTKDNLYGLPIYIPDYSLIQSFEQKASSYEKIIYNNEKESRSLISLRDWLLPMLMNGQATIDD